SHLSVPRHYRVSSPEPRAALQTVHASQPAEPIEAPPGAKRPGADVRLAKRRWIGVVRDARTHLAPHDGYVQFVTDYCTEGLFPANTGGGAGGRPAPGRGSGKGRGAGRRPG